MLKHFKYLLIVWWYRHVYVCIWTFDFTCVKYNLRDFTGVCTYHTWIVFTSFDQNISERWCTMRSSSAIWSMPRILDTLLLTFGLAHPAKGMTTSSTAIHQSKKYQSQSDCKSGTRRCWRRQCWIGWLWTVRYVVVGCFFVCLVSILDSYFMVEQCEI